MAKTTDKNGPLQLKRFDRLNTVNMTGRTGSRAITVMMSGVIRISMLAAEVLELKTGCGVALFQSETEPRDWFLQRDDDKGFKLRKEGAGGSLMFSSAGIARAMLESIQFTGGRGRMLIGESLGQERNPMYPIITASVLDTTRKGK